MKMSAIKARRMFEEMAKIKMQMKELEETYKKFQEIAFDQNLGDYEVEAGKFKTSKRDNWTVADKCAVVKLMGLESYKEHSTISKTGIEKGIGKKGFTKLNKDGAVALSSTSHFYVFKATKPEK